MEKSIEELIYEEPEQRLNQILSPPCVQQRHIDNANVYPFLFCERSPLTLDRFIVSPQTVDALDVEQICLSRRFDTIKR